MSDNIAKRAQIEENKNAYRERVKNFEILKNGLIKKYVSESLDLKNRQEDSVLRIADAPQGDYTFSSGYFNACTAFGKTYLMMAMAEGYRAEEKNKKIIILEENTDVLAQVAEDFAIRTSFNIDDIGVFYKDEKTPEAPIVVCTYFSMEKMMKVINKENVGLVLCDEAHHGLSDKRKEFIRNTFGGACLYGFTGTPEYNANKTCEELFETEIDRVDIREGVNKGLLCSMKNGLMISRIPVDLTGIKTSSGDYDDKKLMEAIDKASHKKGIRESLVKYYLYGKDDDIGEIKGKTTLVNVPNKEEADKLVRLFNEKAGTTIAKAYHEVSNKETLQEFNRGEFPVLVQVRRLSEGYNNPKIDICINYPTASQVREAQCSGRALRCDTERPDKMALILDIVFKKEEGVDVYEQIARNGQVLFKDIAEDVCILSPYHQKQLKNHQKSADKAKDKPQIDEDMLLDIVTDYEDLFTLAVAHDEHMENAFVAQKKENDISLEDFKINYDVYRADGTKIPRKAKKEAFKELAQNEKLIDLGVIGLRKSYSGRESICIIGDKLAELQQETGWVIFKREKIPAHLQKQDTDIGSYDFRVKYDVYLADGQKVKGEKKIKLFKKLAQMPKLIEQGIVVRKLVSNEKLYPFIPADKLAALQREVGYILRPKDDNSGVDKKKANDVGCTEFIYKYHVYQAGNKQVAQGKRKNLFDKIVGNPELMSEGIVANRMIDGGRVFPFIVGSKLKELTQYTGIVISKNSLVAERKDNDICPEDFRNKYHVFRADGSILPRTEKDLMYQQQELKDLGFVEMRQDTVGRQHAYIVGDRLEELQKHTKLVIKTDKEMYYDLETQAAKAQTSDERNKYLMQARRILEKTRPQLKSLKICPQCLQKVMNGRG